MQTAEVRAFYAHCSTAELLRALDPETYPDPEDRRFALRALVESGRTGRRNVREAFRETMWHDPDAATRDLAGRLLGE